MHFHNVRWVQLRRVEQRASLQCNTKIANIEHMTVRHGGCFQTQHASFNRILDTTKCSLAQPSDVISLQTQLVTIQGEWVHSDIMGIDGSVGAVRRLIATGWAGSYRPTRWTAIKTPWTNIDSHSKNTTGPSQSLSTSYYSNQESLAASLRIAGTCVKASMQKDAGKAAVFLC